MFQRVRDFLVKYQVWLVIGAVFLMATAFLLGLVSHTLSVSPMLSAPVPVVKCDCPPPVVTRPAPVTEHVPVVRPKPKVTKRKVKHVSKPLNLAPTCADVPAAAFKAPWPTVLAEARARNVSAAHIAILKQCVGAE